MKQDFDIIVTGGGHSGCEAAAIAARLGSKVLLISMDLNNLAMMSCNPSIGGIAKGQIVREIDALGGFTGIIADKTMIQFRMLNRSKGPAVWSPRSQNDRLLFSKEWRNTLESIKNLFFWQDKVTNIIVKNNKICGVKTEMGITFNCKSLILANGTFLNGKIYIGEIQLKGGRIGEKNADKLTENLVNLGFISTRMKTGTPVRVDGRSIDFSKLEEQKGDSIAGKFSFTDTPYIKYQKSCYLAYTNEEVHNILKQGFEKSPLFSGRIQGIGPRYCPSIEDKIERFSGRNRHQLFVEPEGWHSIEYYINGFSSSLPIDIQYKALRKIKGFEHSRIYKTGYAIEYDFFPPTQLDNTLQTKIIENLYFSGQINGTTGYEEAAAQGLIAGINAHRKINNLSSFTLTRFNSYIGVLIDDLVTKGVDEPYRMFTSRAEYRILLRQDNADLRLTGLAYNIGAVDEKRYNIVEEKNIKVHLLIDFIKNLSITPEEVNSFLQNKNSALINQKLKLSNLLLRPEISLNEIKNIIPFLNEYLIKNSITNYIEEESEIIIKYENYIKKEEEMAEKMIKLENLELSKNFDYDKIISLSTEARQKLNKIKPANIGQATRISGVTPSDISVLIIYLNK